MSWFRKLTDWLGWETVRARDEKGRFISFDKSTPDVDESKKRVYKPRKKPAAKKAPAKKKPVRRKRKPANDPE